MILNNYHFDYSDLHVGDVFKNFTDLCKAIIGETPPTGRRNQDALKREFSKHVEFKKANELDSAEKSKRKLIITNVFETPRKIPENRGTSGKYIDKLAPLILTHKSFSGKPYAFFNEVGVFSRYFDRVMTDKKIEQCENCRIDPIEKNLWAVTPGMYPGEGMYRETMQGQVLRTFCRDLDLLQEKDLVIWGKFHRILPAMTLDINESRHRRFLTIKEKGELNAKRYRFFAQLETEPNVILTLEDVERLDISTDLWDGLELKEYRYLVVRENMYLFPLRATVAQEAALEKVEQFLKQASVKSSFGLNEYPAIDTLPPDFFSRYSLRKEYNKIAKEIYPWLIGCRSVWKEIEYEVIADDEQVKEYIKLYHTDISTCADDLSRAFIDYMDTHMNKVKYQPTKESLEEDSNNLVVFRMHSGPIPERFLDTSKSACELHETLKELYNMNE